jgi:spermidine synthase
MTNHEPAPATRGLLLSVALISAATLAVQVLQTRLFSVMLWHHLTYMVVTVTLLGFGCGGALLALFPRLGQAGGDSRLPVSVCCSLFGLALVAAFSVLCHTPLDTLDIEQDRSKYLLLFLRYAYLVVPFLFAGLAIAIALQQYPAIVHRTYFWNLLGSGVGSFLFVLLVRPLGGPGCLFLFASLGGLAGFLALAGTAVRGRAPAALLAAAAVAIWPLSLLFPATTAGLLPIEPAKSKMLGTMELFYEGYADLYRQRFMPDYPELDRSLRSTVWSPTCRIDTLPIAPPPAAVARDREDPANAPRSQVHVFQDGDAPTVIWSGGYAAELDYTRHWYGLAYRLLESPDVLVIGSGGGNDIETALHCGARHVTAVDINGDTLALVRGKFGAYTRGIYERPDVTPVWSEGRSYLRRSGKTFDAIQMSGTDTYSALSSGSYIFSESYLYTVEAFDDFFAHLGDRGIITVIRFRFEPPREELKLVATAARALRRIGIEDPRRHFLVVNQEEGQMRDIAARLQTENLDGIRHARELKERLARDYKEPMRYAAVLMRKVPFTAGDVATIEQALPPLNGSPLVQHRLYYAAGLRGEDNEYSQLLAAAAEGPSAEQRFHDEYRYRTHPATDDKPFFFNFNSCYMALTGSQPIGLYILAALAIQTLIATALMILLPLLRLGLLRTTQNSRARVLAYFGALGLAYLLVEISTIQRFVLYLGHPVYSLSVGLCSFLVFSGLGSAAAGRRRAGGRGARLAGLVVVALLVAHALLLPPLLQATLAWAEPLRLAVTVAAIAPLAFAMGIPFPTGLGLLAGEKPGVVAWAFGVNGAASVMASILSILVAMEAGFFVVTMFAAGLYAAAALAVPRQPAAVATAT